MVALLNKPRLKSHETVKGKTREKRHITSLVIVPHRDLAYQLLHWIQRMTNQVIPEPHLSSIAQVLVRDGTAHTTTGIASLREVAPHILIGTPQAIMDVFDQDPDALQLSGLSSVVVDEVDYLIETVPKKDPKKSFRKAVEKAERKLLAHPGVTRELLDIIYARRKEANEHRRDEPGVVQHMRRRGSGMVGQGAPQLILSSATLRSHLNNYLFDESGWLNKDNLLKVKGAKSEVAKPEEKVLGAYPHDGLGGTDISHSVLVVSDDGIKNIATAVRLPQPERGEAITPESIFSSSAAPVTEIDESLAESGFRLYIQA